MTPGRAEELAANLAAVEQRIRRACEQAGRDRSEVTLVVVTKTYPASDVARLAALGVREVGESRDQEARSKAAELAPVAPAAAELAPVAPAAPDAVDGLRWHFVGQLQRNKVRSVVQYADAVHSIDRPRLVQALDRAAQEAGRTLDALVQVDLGGGAADPGAPRGGVEPAGVAEVAQALAAARALRLRGVMAVAPRGQDPAAAFDRLAEVARTVRQDHPGATWVSAGMSQDLEQAIERGATHLRVGSAVLGSRPPLGYRP